MTDWGNFDFCGSSRQHSRKSDDGESQTEPNSTLGKAISSQALVAADAVFESRRSPLGQQHLQAGLEKSDPPQKKLPFLQDCAWRFNKNKAFQ
jgi:hypothetical protein